MKAVTHTPPFRDVAVARDPETASADRVVQPRRRHRRRTVRALTVAVVAGSALALAGCATGPTNEQTGAVLGGVLGGLAGTQIGAGTGRTAAIIGGTLIGAAIGGAIGRSMDTTDRQRLFSTLESQPDHRTTAWRNPNTGYQYQATPVRTFQSSGRDCREYQMRAEIDGRWETINGVACRDAQGRWINQ